MFCDYYNKEGQSTWHYDPCGRVPTCGRNYNFNGKLEGKHATIHKSYYLNIPKYVMANTIYRKPSNPREFVPEPVLTSLDWVTRVRLLNLTLRVCVNLDKSIC